MELGEARILRSIQPVELTPSGSWLRVFLSQKALARALPPACPAAASANAAARPSTDATRNRPASRAVALTPLAPATLPVADIAAGSRCSLEDASPNAKACSPECQSCECPGGAAKSSGAFTIKAFATAPERWASRSPSSAKCRISPNVAAPSSWRTISSCPAPPQQGQSPFKNSSTSFSLPALHQVGHRAPVWSIWIPLCLCRVEGMPSRRVIEAQRSKRSTEAPKHDVIARVLADLSAPGLIPGHKNNRRSRKATARQ